MLQIHWYSILAIDFIIGGSLAGTMPKTFLRETSFFVLVQGFKPS